ncbi:MAG: alpha/beta fold hydrolase [Limnohabitans sp.]
MTIDNAVQMRTHVLPDGRRMAFTDQGPQAARDVLLCLPGLLETRQTFAPMVSACPAHVRCLSVDYCGRGDSDPLPGDQGYSMLRYLEDLQDFLNHTLRSDARLHILGTSMGGLLALYLRHQNPQLVQSLLLNDIGLSLRWLSLLSLYNVMKKGAGTLRPAALAAQLGVTPGVLTSVQLQTHFDLPYRKSFRGMHFAHLLQGYGGSVRLVRGQSSSICTPDQVRELHRTCAHAAVLEVADAAHPVPFSALVCTFLLSDLNGAATLAGVPAGDSASSPWPAVSTAERFRHWLQGKWGRR